MHVSFSYAKISGETHFHKREFPRSGSKTKDGEEKKEERLKVGNNNGQLRNGQTILLQLPVAVLGT